MKRKRKTSNQEKGITLVALVVTIIVLLILAGITISLVLGQNGVLSRAQYASNSWANATADEQAMMGKMESEIDRLAQGNGNLETYTITTTITNGTNTGNTSIEENGTATITITADTNYELPNTISVTGATYDYVASTGVITLSNPTGNVNVIATCSEIQTSGRSSITPAPTGSTYTEGQEVTFGNEKFFVLSDDGTTVKLLAKYCLNQDGTEQKNTTSNEYNVVFSTSNYWSSQFSSSPYELNQTNPPELASAIKIANNYGSSKGVQGRLMTHAEANEIHNGSNATMKRILWGRWTGEDASLDSGRLIYWIAAAGGINSIFLIQGWTFEDSNGVGGTLAGEFTDGYKYAIAGVRPVLLVK